MTLAKAFVTGVVVKAPEVRFSQNDLAVASMTINIDQNNETLLRVLSFGSSAETIKATIAQGDSVAVEGKLQANTYKLPNGKDKKIFEINASLVEKISGTSNPVSSPAINTTTDAKPQENIVTFNQDEIASDLIDEEEIPF